jgi:hypothetical protein
VIVFAPPAGTGRLVAGLLSFVGLGGGLAAVFLLPPVLDAMGLSDIVEAPRWRSACWFGDRRPALRLDDR